MNVLTQRIGPLPAWAWGILAAGGVWFFLLRGKPSATSGTSASSGTSPSGQATTDYSLGYAQGLQANAPAPTSTGPAQTRLGHTRTAPPGFPQSGYGAIPIYASPSSTSVVGWASFDSDIHVTGAAQNGRAIPTGTSSWYPIDWGGTQGFVSADDISGFQPGVGGPMRNHSGGSRRSAAHWSDAHPLVGAPVRYPHFVRAVGGAGNHQREIHRVAHQSGVHPARIAMLNPQHTGMIRVA